MSIPLTNYKVNGIDLFSGINGPDAPIGATGYNVNGTNLFTYYTSQGSNYQSNLSKFNYIYNGTPFDIMLYNYFSKAFSIYENSATFNNISGRLCWKITSSTGILFNFPNNTTINFVAIGGGQTGNAENGGWGGGLVYGTFTSTNTYISIIIGDGNANTSIYRSDFTVTAYAGPNSGTSSGAVTATVNYGGAGGTSFPNNGYPGVFISNLGIYSGGGGGGPDTSGGGAPPGGAAGGGSGGNIACSPGGNGAPNTGGGGGAGASSASGAGGSGVVYLYL